ncbi:arabinoxylan arabinofuranohydrolase [Ruminococcus flavefaciens]|uniref:Beta-xylanase n=1 Tax=Ruminococcus flavefaciens TaxID=1265 RepID=A0A1H6J646_RUMFL|nr:endo-1,4-beta-xylanase [Ruminococcus flavefaciens]SEH56190.1 arabinoxylan arabinofuranohydrolase [Ruminococcus flavefaciens]
MKVKKLVASLTAAGCLSGVVTAFPEVLRTYAAEIVYNNFESSYEGWYGEGGVTEVTALSEAGADMSRGMKVSGRTSIEDGAASSKGLYLFGGDKYSYSVKVYSETAEKFHFTLLTIDEVTKKETVVELDSKTVPAGEWTELKGDYTAAEGSYEFKLKITNDSTEDFCFDEFLITGDKAALEAHAAPSGKGLKDEFGAYFRVGNILNGSTVNNSGITGLILKDHNAIECENETKPDATIVQNGSTDTNVKVSLSRCAAICDFAEKNNLAFRGHTLVWHSQTPEWFFKSNFSNNGSYVNSSTMDQRMESYIKNMFAAYKTQYPQLNLYAYDVCNEVINDGTAAQGGLRPTNNTNGQGGSSAWVRVYGNNSFVEKAFTYARKYAPEGCQLFYNDYNEFANDKQNCIINTILKPLQAKGLIDGMGMQSHLNCAASNAWGDTNSYLAAMDKYLNLGLDVQITELDLSTEGGKYSLNDQATKYKAIFQHAMDWNKKHPNGPFVSLVQVWGPNDNNSWVATDKSSGRSNQPLLYDGSNQPKSAYTALTGMLADSQWTTGIPYTGPRANGGGTYTPPEPPKVNEEGYWFHHTFESSDESWTGRGSASVETSSSAKYAGSKSLYCTGRESSWNGASYALDSSMFTPGETYSFSVNAMTNQSGNTEFKFTLQYDDGSGTNYDQIAVGTAPKGEWVQLANTKYTIPAGASNMQIYVETTDETNLCDFFIDEAIGAPSGTVIAGPGQPEITDPGTSDPGTPSNVQVTLGDVNLDGVINSLDMIPARKGLLAGGFTDSKAQQAADVDQSKVYEVADLVLLQEFILGKIKEFPVNKPAVPTLDTSKYEGKFSGLSLAESFKKLNENNPLYTQRFGADPGWMVYDGRLYVYTTADEFAYKNGQMIENDYSSGYINCLSTADLVNWTDHGQIPVAKTRVNGTPIAKWANNAWAPDAAWKNINGQDKFFLYFANNGSGIGVITADDPTFTKNVKDPLGHELISRNTPNSNVTWLFDPGVYYDPDTKTGIIAYGGGVPSGQAANTKQGRIAKLGDDMISISGTPIDPGTPYLFEDSSMIKIGNTWYYSFCHNWNVPGGTSVNGQSFSNADIGYMTSTNPLSGYQYQGVVFKNTGTQRLDNGGNNHHSIIEFKGSYYVLYHSRQLEMRMGVNGGKGLNYRSPCIDKATLNNGKITCSGSQNGVSQIENLNPYETVQAETMSNQSKNISISGIGNTTVKAKKGDWIKVSGVDLSKGVSSITVKGSGNAVVKFCVGSTTGTCIGYGELNGSENVLAAADNNVNGVKDIYMIFSGDCEFDYWQFG